MRREKEKNLSDIVIALCADYERRNSVIKDKSERERVISEYLYINSKLFGAAAEIAGPEQAERYINDIGNAIGYARTEVEDVSEGTYKKMKSEIKENMYRRLNFV